MNDKVRQRMCAGCRERFNQSDLLRICKTENGIKVDKNNNLGGRGAYICSRECALKAFKYRQLNKILKAEVLPEIFEEIHGVFGDGSK